METKDFDRAMNQVAQAEAENQFEEVLRLVQALRTTLEAQSARDAVQLGWVYFYQFKALYHLKRWNEGLNLLETPEFKTLQISLSNLAWCFSVAAEMAVRSGCGGETVAQYSGKAVAIRRQLGIKEDEAIVLKTACTLLDRIKRLDLAEPFFERLDELESETEESEVSDEPPLLERDSLSDDEFDKLCDQGEAADHLSSRGKYTEALNGYTAVITRMQDWGVIDSFLLAKVTLGTLVTLLRGGADGQAFELYRSDPEESLYGLGVQFLEDSQTSIHDLMVHYLVITRFNALAIRDTESSKKAVDYFLANILSWARVESVDWLPDLFAHWRKSYELICEKEVPAAWQAELNERFFDMGVRTAADSVCFPNPSAWEIPEEDTDETPDQATD